MKKKKQKIVYYIKIINYTKKGKEGQKSMRRHKKRKDEDYYDFSQYSA